MQGSATFLAVAAGLAVVPLYFVRENQAGRTVALTASMSIAGVAIGLWLVLPSAYVVARAVPLLEGERSVALSEGLTEVITVTEAPDKGRTLLTNGHSMSSTTRLSQRYMRALAHIPLLAMEHPETVLVIGFGVGNTTHAATLHPSIRRVEVADLSRGILAHAGYFSDVNRDVLQRSASRRVRERWAAASADAASGLVRPDHPRAPAHRIRRRRRALFPGVLRAGADVA